MEFNWLYLILFVVGFFVLLVALNFFTKRVERANSQNPNPGIGAEATQTGMEVGRDVVRTTLIWTLASMMSNFFKSLFYGRRGGK